MDLWKKPIRYRSILVLLLFPLLAYGQSIPNGPIVQGQVWTPAQWNAAWQSKVDVPGSTTPQFTTASANQTVFTLTALPSIGVFLDGVRLYPTKDYNIIGLVLTLTNGALSGQVLYVN